MNKNCDKKKIVKFKRNELRCYSPHDLMMNTSAIGFYEDLYYPLLTLRRLKCLGGAQGVAYSTLIDSSLPDSSPIITITTA